MRIPHLNNFILQILKKAFQGQGANNIALPTLASGVYVIKLTTESGIINRKIILN